MAKKTELLSPAGDMEKLVMAVTYGADAVYLAGSMFGMRAAAGNFSSEELIEAVRLCHGLGVKVYVTCNTVPNNSEIALLPPFLEFSEHAGVDGLIIAVSYTHLDVYKRQGPCVAPSLPGGNHLLIRQVYDRGRN